MKFPSAIPQPEMLNRSNSLNVGDAEIISRKKFHPR